MSLLEDVIRTGTMIEQQLTSRGAQGLGIRALSESVRSSLSDDLFARIQLIAAVRNKYAHIPNFKFDGNEFEIRDLCNDVLRELQRQNQNDLSDRDAKLSDPINSNKRRRMEPTSSVTWVKIQTTKIKGRAFYSTEHERLVFFRGSGVFVKPIGEHVVPWLFTSEPVTGIGVVTMLPAEIPLSSVGEIVSREGIKIDLRLAVILSVTDETVAIERVAIDDKTQQQLAIFCVIRAAQEVIGLMEYDELRSDKVSLADSIKRQALRELPSICSFQINNVLVSEITATDPAIRNDNFSLMKANAQIEQMRIGQQLKTIEQEFNAEQQKRQANLEATLDAARNDAELRLKQQTAAATLEIDAARVQFDYEREMLRFELEKQRSTHVASLATDPNAIWAVDVEAAKLITLEKIRSETELAKERLRVDNKILQMAVTGAVVTGRMGALEDVLARDRNMTFRTLYNSDVQDERLGDQGKPSPEVTRKDQSSSDDEPDQAS